MKFIATLSLVGVVILSTLTSQVYGACETSDSLIENFSYADNCARAVTGTRLGPGHVASASKDCVSYFAPTATYTLVEQTSTVISMVVTTLTISQRQVSPTTRHLPVYASECKDATQYFSACSCGFGLTTSGSIQTITGLSSTITITRTSTTKTTQSSTTPTCTADILSDPLNCGRCRRVCSSGKCQNGACGSAQCANNQTCDGGFKNCGASNCFCFSDSSGIGFCGINAVCFSATACNNDRDCNSGSICAKETCCPPPSEDKPGICLLGECDNPASQLIVLSKMQHSNSRGGTAAYGVTRERNGH